MRRRKVPNNQHLKCATNSKLEANTGEESARAGKPPTRIRHLVNCCLETGCFGLLFELKVSPSYALR